MSEIRRESSPEELLSPEIIERIMEKVKDINEPGLAYTGITTINDLEKNLPSVLADGLIGTREGMAARQKQEEAKQPANTYFNINGRSKNVYHQLANTLPVSDTNKPQLYYGRFSTGVVNVVVDVSAFSEVAPDFYAEYYKNDVGHDPKRHSKYDGRVSMEKNKYMVTPSPEDPEVVVNDAKSGKVTTSYSPGTGFVTPSAVSPEYLRGIVVPEVTREATTEELKENPDIPYRLDESNEAMQKKQAWIQNISEILQVTYQNEPEKLLPIYDASGNLVWPKQMDYKEVKQLIKKRDKDKKDEN